MPSTKRGLFLSSLIMSCTQNSLCSFNSTHVCCTGIMIRKYAYLGIGDGVHCV